MRKLLRIENLLVLAPVCIGSGFLYAWIGVPEDTEEFYLGPQVSPGIFLFMDFLGPIIQWAFMLLPLYLMHYFLRSIGRRNKVVCFIHAVVTTIVILYWALFANFATSVVPGWHTTIYPPQSAGPFLWLSILFWLLQVLFILHGLIIIHKWKRTGSKP